MQNLKIEGSRRHLLTGRGQIYTQEFHTTIHRKTRCQAKNMNLFDESQTISIKTS